MRIFEIEPGEKQRLNFDSFDKFWMNRIETECSEALEEMRQAGNLLYRGSNDFGNFYKGASYNDRKAKDSYRTLTVIWDQLLLQLGFEAIRANSIFCTSNVSHAGRFGKVYCIFPINGFKYTYSPRLPDVMIDSWSRLIDDEKAKIIYDEYKKVSNDYVFHTVRTVSTPAEMVNGLKKLMPDSRLIQSLTPEFLINPTDFQEKYEFTNSNLSEGLIRRSEILISGTYYAITQDLETQIMRKLAPR